MKLRNISLFAGSAMGAIVFVIIYGGHILNPAYTDWLMGNGRDLSQHYFGWNFYRNSSRDFPLGLMNTLGYPYQTSVLYTDSIPLLAVFFKALSPVLPEQFQYFGLWGLLCFMLQGLLGAMICRKYTESTVFNTLGSLLFILSPVILQRMYYHSALAAHWLILIALLFLINQKQLSAKFRNALLAWALLGALIAAIHQYFLVMCGIICVGYSVYEIIRNRRWYGFATCISFISGALIVDLILGLFLDNVSSAAWGLGDYSFNLNGLINPQGFSAVFSNLPTYNDQHEGFAYLGLGIIVLSIGAVVVREYLLEKDEQYAEQTKIRHHLADILVYGLIILLCIGVSVSPVITWGNNILLTLELPEVIVDLWSIFRSTGRLIWPVIYIIILAGVSVIMRRKSKYPVIIFLICCIGLQFYDLSEVIAERNERYNNSDQYVSLLADEGWAELEENAKFKHLIISNEVVGSDYLYEFADLASRNKWTLNDFYFARNVEGITDSWQESIADPQPDMLFVLTQGAFDRIKMISLNTMYFYELDGFFVGATDAVLPKRIPMDRSEIVYYYPIGSNSSLFQGEDRDGIRYLYSGGISYGPYLTIPAGVYDVSIKGTKLDLAEADSAMNEGNTVLPVSDYYDSPAEITYRFEVGSSIQDLEIRVRNHSDQTISINEISITPVGNQGSRDE